MLACDDSVGLQCTILYDYIPTYQLKGVDAPPGAVSAHARMVLVDSFLQAPMKALLFAHSKMEFSLPSQSTDASATGRSLNSTCAQWQPIVDALASWSVHHEDMMHFHYLITAATTFCNLADAHQRMARMLIITAACSMVQAQ